MSIEALGAKKMLFWPALTMTPQFSAIHLDLGANIIA